MGCAVDKMLHIKSEDQLIEKCDPRITPSQKVIVKDTWQILKLNIANVGVKTFVGMFESRPELIQIFGAIDGHEVPSLPHSGLIHEHALRVMATVDAVVIQLDDRRTLSRTHKDVGQIHRKYNVPNDIIPTILPHFLAAIKPHIDATWSDEVNESWTALFDILIYCMTEGEVQQSGSINSGYSVCHKTILSHFLAAIKPHIDATWSDEVSESWTALFDVCHILHDRRRADTVCAI